MYFDTAAKATTRTNVEALEQVLNGIASDLIDRNRGRITGTTADAARGRACSHLSGVTRKTDERKPPSSILSGGIRFATVQECLDFLPADERALMDRLREFVISEAPQLNERLSYNILAYKLRRDVCFLWPASVLWGGKKTYDGVRFGFSHADVLSDPSGYLERGTRKQVYWRDLQQFTRADERMLAQLLSQAVHMDEERGKGLR